jgi:hypothetical protein
MPGGTGTAGMAKLNTQDFERLDGLMKTTEVRQSVI